MESQADTSALTGTLADTAPAQTVTQENAQELSVAEAAVVTSPDPKDVHLLNLIRHKVFMALRTLPTRPPAFNYDHQPMTMDVVTAAAKAANIPLGNRLLILMLRHQTRASGMVLAV